MVSRTSRSVVPVERIASRIYLIRGQKVMLDADLANLYAVPTKVFNQAVRRNLDRFPKDFMIQLTQKEAASLRSQIVTLERGRGRYPKYAPLAFTEQGVAMLSSVLRSKRAAQVNLGIMRAFVRLRVMLATNEELARRFSTCRRRGHLWISDEQFAKMAEKKKARCNPSALLQESDKRSLLRSCLAHKRVPSLVTSARSGARYESA
jgi:hypothetical protein